MTFGALPRTHRELNWETDVLQLFQGKALNTAAKNVLNNAQK